MIKIENNQKQGELANIKRNLIVADEVALRGVNKKRLGDKWTDMVASIESMGIQQPISVRRIPEGFPGHDEGKVVIIDGLHRWEAANELGLDEIPCQVFEDTMSFEEVLVRQVLGNAHRLETRPAEYADHIQRLMARDETLTQADVATILNKNQAWVSRILKLNKLNDEAKELVNDNAITLATAVALAQLPAEEQPDWYDRAQSMNADEFTVYAAERATELRKRSRNESATDEFTPKMKLMTRGGIQNLFGQLSQDLADYSEAEMEEMSETSSAKVGQWIAVRTVLGLDPEEVERQREEWDAQQRERLRKKSEKEAAKAAEAALGKGSNVKGAALPLGFR